MNKERWNRHSMIPVLALLSELFSDSFFQECDKLLKVHRCALDLLDGEAVFLIEADENVAVCLSEVVHNTVDIRLQVLRTPDIQVLIGTDMQRVGNAEMIPEELVECGIFVNPYDLVDRHNRISIDGGLNKKMFRDKHIQAVAVLQAPPPPALRASSDCQRGRDPGSKARAQGRQCKARRR